MPTFAVIKVNSQGEAKITKQWLHSLDVMRDAPARWRKERRNARRGRMQYFRLCCIIPDDSADWWGASSHAKLDGMAFKINEPFSCRCCFAEWLYSREDVKKAKAEIEKRKAENKY